MKQNELSQAMLCFRFIPDGNGGSKLHINTNALLELLVNNGVDIDDDLFYGYLLTLKQNLVGIPANKSSLLRIAEVIWTTAKDLAKTEMI